MYFRADEDLRDQIEDYEARGGHEDRSSAIRELLETGLRESQSPILCRFKDQIIDYVGNLGIMAVIVLLTAFTTPVLSAGAGAKLAIALVVTAGVLLAVLELSRVVAGHNPVGQAIRELYRDTQEVQS
jgi:hypothetical protein